MGLEPNELSLDYKQELYGNLNHVSISPCNKASDITFTSIEVMVLALQLIITKPLTFAYYYLYTRVHSIVL